MAQNLQDPLYQALFSENDQSRDEKQKEDDQAVKMKERRRGEPDPYENAAFDTDVDLRYSDLSDKLAQAEFLFEQSLKRGKQ